MFDQNGKENNKPPGEIIKLQVTVTASIVLFVAVLLLTLLYVKEESWRPAIVFAGTGFGIEAGILSAYYVGRGLKVTIEQRDKALTEEKISRAFVLASRWNEPNFAKLREDWRALVTEVTGKDEHAVCEILERDHHKQTVASDVLNFFEELAFAARSGVAEMDTLKNVHRSIVIRYYSAILPWIARIRRNQPTAYEHFEWLRNKWQ
jgi:hypothetical protein